MENDLLEKKFVYLFEEFQPSESFYKLLKLGREDYFATFKQSYPRFEI